MPVQRLVLFDIDGTFLHGGPVWRECFEAAIAAILPEENRRGLHQPTVETSKPGSNGTSDPSRLAKLAKISFAGKTDGWICREILGAAGIADTELDRWVPRILEHYLELAHREAPKRTHEVTALPGAHRILEELKAVPGMHVGLLTGNLKAGAHLKLSSVGLDPYFTTHDFSAFGDDHWNRYELPQMAVEKASRALGIHFKGKEVVIIGDTIHDVKCGKSIGARAIAVGTGHQANIAELLAAEPDFYFDDLSHSSKVIEAILESI